MDRSAIRACRLLQRTVGGLLIARERFSSNSQDAQLLIGHLSRCDTEPFELRRPLRTLPALGIKP